MVRLLGSYSQYIRKRWGFKADVAALTLVLGLTSVVLIHFGMSTPILGGTATAAGVLAYVAVELHRSKQRSDELHDPE